LASIDSQVSSSTNRLLVNAMKCEDDVERGHTKQTVVDLESFQEKRLEDFFSVNGPLSKQ
jgi:hypothetical protein